MSDGDWFAPKRFGYGAGGPVSWRGWAALGVFVAVLTALGFGLLPRHPVLYGVGVAILLVSFTIIVAQHTRGGWRWRWGARD